MKTFFIIFSLIFAFFAFGQEQNICYQDIKTYSVDLPSGTPGSTYSWTLSSPEFVGTITGNGTHSIEIDWGNTPVGTYNLEVIETHNECPGIPQILTINVNPLPTAPTVSNNSEICFNDTAEFYIVGEPNLEIDYILNGISNTTTLDALGQITLSIPNATVNQNLLISSVMNSFGCSIDTNISSDIIVNTLPEVPSITNNGPLCFDETAIFTINAAPNETIDYILNGANTSVTTDANGEAIITIPNADSNQNLVLTNITNAKGCSIPLNETSEIIVNALPTETTITENGPICAGETAIFDLQGSPNEVITYLLDGTAGTITLDTNGIGQVTLPNASNNVIFDIETITNSNNCSITSISSATVVVNPLPVQPTLVSNSPICYNETAEFTISGGAGDTITYLLNGVQNSVNLDTSGQAIISVNNAQADQTLQITQVENSLGCSITVNLSETLIVEDLPTTTPIIFN